MRRQLTLLFLIVFSLTLHAQDISITISGNVANQNGTPVPNLNVNISTDSTITWPGYNTVVTTDGNGDYSDTFTVPEGLSQGIIFVSTQDCDGSTLFATTSWFPGNLNPEVDFLYCSNVPSDCSVMIGPDSLCLSDGIGLGTFTSGSGGANYSYLWSTGETTSEIVAPEDGTYCVTLTDNATGCEATDCYILVADDISYCFVYIEPTPVGALFAQASGCPPFTYAWNTGENSESIFNLQEAEYCVTITDNTGCESVDCYYYDPFPVDTFCFVDIFSIDSSGTGFIIEAAAGGTAPFTYLWDTGETTSTISVGTAGIYCVTITDADGCTASTCEQINLSYCNVNLSIGQDGNIYTSTTGQAPFSYSWNTGETTDFITPDSSGIYCVTVTDDLGCVTDGCIWWNSGNPSDTLCSISIIEVQNGTWLQAVVNTPFDYEVTWNTGATDLAIPINGPGEYCATVVDAYQCVATACYTVQLTSNDIEGVAYVYDSITDPDVLARVYLITLSAAGLLEAVDSTDVNLSPGGVGQFGFYNLPDGEYRLKTAMLPGSNYYPDYLPTYYFSDLWWDDATVIQLPSSPFTYYPIEFIPGDNPGGPGFIGGYVSDGANLKDDEVDIRSEGGPMPNVSIILLDEFNQPVTHTVTDQDGLFEFPDLAYGTYHIYVEIIGIEQHFVTVTIGPDQPSVENIRFEVLEDVINSNEIIQVNNSIRVFPNPVSENLQILSEQTIEQIIIRDLSGRVLFESQTDLRSVDLKSWQPGWYHLQIQTRDGLYSEPIIKQ